MSVSGICGGVDRIIPSRCSDVEVRPRNVSSGVGGLSRFIKGGLARSVALSCNCKEAVTSLTSC
jgi:hypothetical protein